MRIYFNPTPVVSLEGYEDAQSDLYKAIELMPIYDSKEDIVYYPLSKLENGRYLTFWKPTMLKRKFVNHEDDQTLESVEDMLKQELELDELLKRIEHLETFTTKFHVKFKSRHSVAIAKVYTYGYLYLQGKLDYQNQSEFRIESSVTNFKRLKKAVGLAEDKLVQNFHSLIMDLGCKSYHEYEKSVKLKFRRQLDKPGKVTHLRRMKVTRVNELPRFDLSLG